MISDLRRISFSERPVLVIKGGRYLLDFPVASSCNTLMILDFISSVALLVKVTARIWVNSSVLSYRWERYSRVSLNVFPEPADALTMLSCATVSEQEWYKSKSSLLHLTFQRLKILYSYLSATAGLLFAAI